MSVPCRKLATGREKEKNYKLRKELFAFSDNKIAVQFWYEYQDAYGDMKWKRCCEWTTSCIPTLKATSSGRSSTFRTYPITESDGLEDWTFAPDGRMRKRQMSGNDVLITDDAQRWYRACESEEDLDAVHIDEAHW